MLPVVALVGRPNVGKSTLFNQLTRSRDALVADQPGLTRDRKYGLGKLGSRPYLVIDTGGIADDAAGIGALIEKQVLRAVDEADHILLILDAKEGCCAADEMLAARLRALGKPITATVNKTESLDPDLAVAEFHSLGLGSVVPIAAAHGQGVRALIDQVLASIPTPVETIPLEADRPLQIAVVGRPNVGKSTLINRLLGEERVLAFDQPGTTRDSIFVPFSRNGRSYTLIDTAGLRRRARVSEVVEKFSIIKTLQAIEQSNAIILMLDARQGIGDQDAHIAGHVLDSGRALVIAVNKWDGLETDQRARVRQQIEQKLPFLSFAAVRFVSALRGSGVGRLLNAVEGAFANATRDLKTSELTAILEEAVSEHQPPLSRGRRIKLRYAHQGGRNPPIIVIHGNQSEAVPPGYRRYLVNRFRHALRLEGTPIRIEFKSGANPFSGRTNKLTPRQQRKRQRLRNFVNRKK